MNARKSLNKKISGRKRRNRAKIFGTGSNPRLSVFRSNRFIYAQLIDDGKQRTVVSVSSRELDKKSEKMRKTEKSKMIGELIAKKALAAGIKRVILDRGSYRYQGRVRALADGARNGGLKI